MTEIRYYIETTETREPTINERAMLWAINSGKYTPEFVNRCKEELRSGGYAGNFSDLSEGSKIEYVSKRQAEDEEVMAYHILSFVDSCMRKCRVCTDCDFSDGGSHCDITNEKFATANKILKYKKVIVEVV